MIVRMKKITLLFYAQELTQALNVLRQTAAMHIEHLNPPQGKELVDLHDELNLVDSAVGILNSSRGHLNVSYYEALPVLKDWKVLAQHLVDARNRILQLEEYSHTLKKNISEWERWGDFEPKEVQDLAEKSIFVSLYEIPVKETEKLRQKYLLKEISVFSGIANCLVIARKKIELDYKEVPLPKNSLSKMRQRLEEDVFVIKKLKSEILDRYVYLEPLIKIRKDLSKGLEFLEAAKGSGQDSVISYVHGYVPVDRVNSLSNTAKNSHWALVVNDPAEEDNVPTLIRNPKWVSLINPVFKLLEIVPGYHELDISLLFLIFFSLFFGILIGDAGYGLIYLVLTFWLHKKFGKKHQSSKDFFLFYVLSFCAIIWGLLTGTFFGQEWFLKAGFKPLLPALNNTKNIQALCFFIGALHLTLAHSWRAILKLPSLAALADIGWVSVLWAAFFFAKLLILSEGLPVYATWLLFAGVILVVLFTNPQKNILKAIGEGLGTLALGLMNNFTDVVSYVRLFAVGLAGVAIADTFNNMATGLGTSNIISIIAAGFIIVAGHSLNLILGPMSVLVHGVRLNVLEFSGHASVTWSGFSYKPFKE